MSAFSDAMSAVRSVILMQSKLERLEGQIEHLSSNLDGVKDYAVTLDRRLARVEGFIDGAATASAGRTRRLTKE